MLNKSFVALLFFCLMKVHSFAQWVEQDTLGGRLLEDAHFFSADTGIGVGWNGVIVKTVDGGTTWVDKPSGTAAYLFALSFVDDKYGVAVGDGVVLRTMDGGDTWSSFSVGDRLKDVSMIDSIGYAVSYTYDSPLFFTSDSGKTWQEKDLKLAGASPLGIYFTSQDIGYLGTDGELFKTTNGGETWEVKSDKSVSAFHFPSPPDTGYAVGGMYAEFALLKTIDGGETWIDQSANAIVASRNAYNITPSVYFTSVDTGYAVGGDPTNNGYEGLILKTMDGGETWRTMKYPDFGNMYTYFTTVCFPTNSIGYIVGVCPVLKTTNGGGTEFLDGIEEMTNPSQWVLYPNPATTYFQIDFENNTQQKKIEIFDSMGKKVLSIPLKKRNNKVKIGALSKGVYSVRIFSNNKIQTTILIKY